MLGLLGSDNVHPPLYTVFYTPGKKLSGVEANSLVLLTMHLLFSFDTQMLIFIVALMVLKSTQRF